MQNSEAASVSFGASWRRNSQLADFDDSCRRNNRWRLDAASVSEAALASCSAEEMKNKSFFVQKSVKMRKSIGSKFIEFCFISIT
jgi:hypothetical protein